MKIEFSAIGDGTNIQVTLLEELGSVETVVDHIYTSEHQGGLHFDEEGGVPIDARQIFEWVEDCWKKPAIGGRYSSLHPYWREREEKRCKRAGRVATDAN